MDEATEAIFRSLNPKRDIGRIDEVVVNPGALCFESREETELKMGSNRSGLFRLGLSGFRCVLRLDRFTCVAPHVVRPAYTATSRSTSQ